MANEGVIKINFYQSGEENITCKILKPDDTVRDAQSAIALIDTDHDNLYSNAGAITIEAGDSVVPYWGAANLNAAFEYLPKASAITVADKTGYKLASDGADLVVASAGDIEAIKNQTDLLPASPAPANEYDTELDATISSRATVVKQDAGDVVTSRIAAIQEADRIIDFPNGTLKYKTKGTATVLLTKNLLDPDDAAVDSTEDVIAAEENV